MGKRARRDPAEHTLRGKGHPTPPQPQNQPALPPPVQAVFVVGHVQVGAGESPAFDGQSLIINVADPTGAATLQLIAPMDAAGPLAESITQVAHDVGAGPAANGSGVVVASPGDVAQAAAAVDGLRSPEV